MIRNDFDFEYFTLHPFLPLFYVVFHESVV